MLDQDFCSFLEYEMSKAFANSFHKELAGFWCDGVLLPIDEMLSQKVVNDKRELKAVAFIGTSGQDKYELILLLGRRSLSRYARNLDITCCVPSPESDEWIEVDQVHRKVLVRLI